MFSFYLCFVFYSENTLKLAFNLNLYGLVKYFKNTVLLFRSIVLNENKPISYICVTPATISMVKKKYT